MVAEGESTTRERLAMLGEIALEIAHELRNMLQVISVSAYVARQELNKGGRETVLFQVGQIERNARKAHAIVDDLMALARHEALHCEIVLLAEMMAAARAELPTGCAHWDDSLEPHDLRVRAHVGLFVRLLHVLYDNAIGAASPRVPRISTQARSDGGRIVIHVTDDGPGVPSDIASGIFDPLVTARPGGTGLGLPLARRIATAHGGSISLIGGMSAGATFRVELPGT